MVKKPFTGALLALFLVVSAPVPAAMTPTETVRLAIQEILTILDDKTIASDERWARIAPVIAANFDFRAMSQGVLATHWQSATPAEQKQFVEFFSQYIEATYRTRIEAYTDQEVRFVGEKTRGDRAIVDTVIVTDSTEIPVRYRMRFDGGRWYAYDVVIEGVGLVNNYRNLYAALGKSGGVQGILDDVQMRIDAYREAGEGSQAGGAE